MGSGGDRDKKGTADRRLDDDDPLLELLKTFRLDSPYSAVREEILGDLVRSEIERLSRPGARNDFDQLCAAGCNPAVLVAIISLFRYRRQIEGFWTLVGGSSEQRKDICGALESAAAAIEQAFPSIVFNNEADRAKFARIGRVPPAQLASELRLYSRTLQYARLLADDIGVRSLEHISTLILASYVEKTTGANHHGAISGIIAEVSSKPDYAEDAQKQWSYRNRTILDDPSSAPSRIANFLMDVTLALNQVT